MKSAIVKLLLPLTLLLVLSACTPSYHFKVDAISDGAMQTEGSFFIVSGNPELKESDLRFREAATLVQTALEGKGFYRSPDVASADMLVEISFGMGEPREVLESRSYPETYWRPGFSYAIRIPVYDKSGDLVSFQTRIVREPSRSYTYWEERLDSTTLFEKHFTIEAFDNRLGSAQHEPQQLWSVVITNADSSDDLRGYLPYMIAAALPYVGTDTGSQIYVSIRPDDPTVQFLRSPDSGVMQD